MELDEIDLKLLAILQEDASLNNLALAERVHVSAPTCLRRIKRLVESGWIERQVAVLNRDKLGHGLHELNKCPALDPMTDMIPAEGLGFGGIGVQFKLCLPGRHQGLWANDQ